MADFKSYFNFALKIKFPKTKPEFQKSYGRVSHINAPRKGPMVGIGKALGILKVWASGFKVPKDCEAILFRGCTILLVRVEIMTPTT